MPTAARTGLTLIAALLFAGVLIGMARGDDALDSKAKLGAALFADRNLSITRGQSCISCHSPNLAFTDPRTLGKANGAVSRGADRKTLGDRNAPTLLYAALAPDFTVEADGRPRGGFFLDGRATTLEAQAGEPLLNPREMAMPDRAGVAARIKENPDYVAAFRKLFGADVLTSADTLFAAVEQALATFNRTPDFARFDARYDRALKGEAQLSDLEQRGRDLFFGKAGCATCHSSASGAKDTFTDYRYYNLGVPANAVVRQLNGAQPGAVDVGVRTTRSDLPRAFDGAFKVPSLRNVAVTSPYMHNGIFEDLATAIRFHARFAAGSDGDAAGGKNPETGKAWAAPEVAGTLDRRSLQAVPALSDADIAALVAFLATLTDREFEELLPRR